MVEPPAYTFSGIVPKGKLPKDDKRGSFSKDRESPGAGRALFQEGMSEYVEGHYAEATGYLESAVQLEPKAADINFYLGICKLLQGHPEESIVPLKNAAAAGPSIYLQPSHYYLAKAYVQSNKFAEAEDEFRKAIAAPGRLTSDAKGLLARLQTLRGQIEKP
jgi:tetratricopeptide (TPR) repeat protein